MTIFLELLALGLLLLLNAFFVAAEYGLVTARRTKIVELEQQGNRRARDVLRIVSRPPRFIAAMQLGVTLTSLGIGALGEPVLAELLDPVLATILAVAIAFVVITTLHVVIGELVPKGIALGYPARPARSSTGSGRCSTRSSTSPTQRCTRSWSRGRRWSRSRPTCRRRRRSAR